MNLSILRKRTREENDHTFVTIFGGAVVGGVIFGPTGALIGEYGNEDRYIPDLSGGELQRVAIAACLSRNADLYLLDEPSAHLDVEQRTLAIREIRRFVENNNATAMVVEVESIIIKLRGK